MNLHFGTFRLQPPHAPPSSGNARCSGRAWPPFRIGLLSAVLRTSHIPSSLVSRIRPYRVCVPTLTWAAFLRTIRSLPVALHPVSPRRSYFQLLAGSSAREGLSPSCACSLSSALGRRSCGVAGGSWARVKVRKGLAASHEPERCISKLSGDRPHRGRLQLQNDRAVAGSGGPGG